MIPIRIIGPSHVIDIYCLLDSGAQNTIIPRYIAEDTGLDLSAPTQTGYTATAPFPIIPSKATIQIGRSRAKRVVFEDMPLSVADTPDFRLPLLGRNLIFDRFTVTFRQYKNQFSLEAK